MVVVAGVYLGPVAQSQNPANCVPQTCLTNGIFAIIGLVGFGIALWGVVGSILGSLVRAGYIQLKPPETHPQIGSSPEDEKILAIANELLGETKLPRIRYVGTLAWSENLPWYGCRFKRQGFRKPPQLLLWTPLRGSLEPEDWKILLAYYFAHLKPRFWMMARSMFWLSAPVFAFLLVGAEVSSVYGRQAAGLYAQAIATPFLLLWLIRIFPWAKKMSLKHDAWVANSLGRERLLRLFEKIDGLKLPDVEIGKRRKGWIARLWPMPNITERIENLMMMA